MVLFNPQLSPANGGGFGLRPAAAPAGAQNGNTQPGTPGVDPQQQRNLQRADELAAACASCGSGCGCGGGSGGGADIRTAVEQGQDPNAAFEAFKQRQYNEIFAHESAHQSAAGSFGGGINIEYGANGVPVGGHVNVEMPSLDSENPELTVQHAQTVARAALAPSEPSGQDLSVASQAQAILGRAQVMMQEKQARERQGLPPQAAAASGPVFG